MSRQPGDCNHIGKHAYAATLSYRLVTAFIGVVLIGSALWIFVDTSIDRSFSVTVLILLLMATGLQSLWSAWRKKQSFLSRLGPLP